MYLYKYSFVQKFTLYLQWSRTITTGKNANYRRSDDVLYSSTGCLIEGRVFLDAILFQDLSVALPLSEVSLPRTLSTYSPFRYYVSWKIKNYKRGVASG
jgi:hypothetical protein